MARKMRKKALVIGVGNILLRDEGLGVRAAEYFERNFSFGPEVACLDGGTSGLGLLSYIREYSHLIIVDAVSASGKPGAVIRIPGEKVHGFPSLKSSSAHQIGIRDLLAIARFEGLDPEVVVIGIIPGDISAGLELTPEAEKSLPLAADAIGEELEKFGFRVRKKAA